MNEPLINVLKKIQAHPITYLYDKSLTSLCYFIDGYTCKAREHNPYYSDSLSGKTITYGIEFEAFVFNYFSCTNFDAVKDWCFIIIERSDSDAAAFDKFLELFSKYVEGKVDDPNSKYVPLDNGESPSDDPLYTKLKKMCDLYYLYFRVKSILHIYHFIAGYTYRSLVLDPDYRDRFSGTGFGAFVHNHFRTDEINRKKEWVTVLLENSESEEEAFDIFFELLDEFMGAEKEKARST